MNCEYHPKRRATHRRTVIDNENSGQHEPATRYKKVPICWECAYLYTAVATERIEAIEERVAINMEDSGA